MPDTRDVSGSDTPVEPVAIVGMACRFPDAPDLAAYWRLLEEGRQVVSEGEPGSGAGRVGELFPEATVAGNACRFGAYLDDIDQFDPAFFRISPVEAQVMDPQQRMMLETSWRAIEDAGFNPETLQGSRTGVYTGTSNPEYRQLVLESSEPVEAAFGLYASIGTSLHGVSGRVAYVLGVAGPSMVVDAACASSLVTVHLAATALRRGEADIALAGGAHAILDRRLFEQRAVSGMLSPDGRCKAFDAGANGFVRGEGCGVVVLKRLSAAEADGDRIWGVVRGSAVNHVGASVGLTVPDGPAQEQVIEDALLQAGLVPAEVDYLEAHGTGTEVGDPIELEAAAAVYGRAREPERPLLIGSVKTNMGHLEPAAGIAGLIKTVLAMRREWVPKHLHFHSPNPRVDWQRLPLRVVAEAERWPRHPGRPPRAGVSAYGMSGTNAHVVVEGYGEPAGEGSGVAHWVSGAPVRVPAPVPEPSPEVTSPEETHPRRTARLLPLSAKTETALGELAERYLAWLGDGHAAPGADPLETLADMAWTAAVGREHHVHRAAVPFRDARSLKERLRALADALPAQRPAAVKKMAFAYTGQGSQWPGMGEALYEGEPVARAVLDRCDAVFREANGSSLLDVMFARAGTEGQLDRTARSAPALYALECALTAQWSSLGVRPDVVLGHSMGEVAAAQAAGVFSLEDGMRFAMARGALLGATEKGAMAAVFAPADRVLAAVEELNANSNGPGVSLAADNGTHRVVSGAVPDIEAITERFESDGINVKRLRTVQAFHSALLDPALDDLQAALDGVPIATPSIEFVSNVTGRVFEPGQKPDGAYWRRHARQPVAFAGGVRTLAELGVDLVVELGPRPVLGPLTSLVWPEPAAGDQAGRQPVVLCSLQGAPDDRRAADADFAEAVGKAYEAGLDMSLEGLFAGEERRRVAVPGYPLQRRRHWIAAGKRRRSGVGHALLGVRHESPAGELMFETELSATDPAWLTDHRVFGRVVVPGALYGAMAVSAAMTEGSGAVVVADFQLHSPLILPEEEAGGEAGDSRRPVQLVLDAADGARARRVAVYSKQGDGGWTLHVEGRLSRGGVPEARARADLDRLRGGMTALDVAELYSAKSDAGIDFGPAFRGLQAVWSAPGEAFGEIAVPHDVDQQGLEVHPLLLDGCFQLLSAARGAVAGGVPITYMPFGWDRLWLTGPLPDRIVCHVRLGDEVHGRDAGKGAPAELETAEVRLYDPHGAALGGIHGFTVKRATRAALAAAVEGIDDLLYEVVWRDRPLAEGASTASWLVDTGAIAQQVNTFGDYLSEAAVSVAERRALETALGRLGQSYALAALARLGWRRTAGSRVEPQRLCQELGIRPEHRRLSARLLGMLSDAGILAAQPDGYVVAVAERDALPHAYLGSPEDYAAQLSAQHRHGLVELGVVRRCGGGLADVLAGRANALDLLFGGEPSVGDLYKTGIANRAWGKLLGDAVAVAAAGLPDGRRLRIVEVGGGTGSATEWILPKLPSGRFDYTFTDISAGFFADAELRFGKSGESVEFKVLDIEAEPAEQGFEPHACDLVIAANVLHATRDLGETLANCRKLLAPSGQLLALESLCGESWRDIVFGLLPDWWRFADDYRPHHALAPPDVWRRALSDAGFTDPRILGHEATDDPIRPAHGLVLARGPAVVDETPGVWVLAGNGTGLAAGLAAELAARNQTVVAAGASDTRAAPAEPPGVIRAAVETRRRDSWRALLDGLPGDAPLRGIVHLGALDGRGLSATTEQLKEDVTAAAGSALALVQGCLDANVEPAQGVWFVTRGAQALERERGGQPAGATLWGLGKVVAREAATLRPRMIDLDPGEETLPRDFINELLFPDRENHIARRGGSRLAARLVRGRDGTRRLALPAETGWRLARNSDGADGLRVEHPPGRLPGADEVRVAVEAAGLNSFDAVREAQDADSGPPLGRELCGRVVEAGSAVKGLAPGDRVVGLAVGAFGPEVVTRAELVVQAPPDIPAAELATVPVAFGKAALALQVAGLRSGDQVLVHADADGVGLAAAQLARAAGAEVFATADSPQRGNVLRSLGVETVVDGRQADRGRRILETTGGDGVRIAVDMPGGAGSVEPGLACLAAGAELVETRERTDWEAAAIASARPDVRYHSLALEASIAADRARWSAVLGDVIERIANGTLAPLPASRWPLAEARLAMDFLLSERHAGKAVLVPSPLAGSGLRDDRTYLVTGGLGGIGGAVAAWLADLGARSIVLNGRRAPGAAAEDGIRALRERGVRVQVELADVAVASDVQAMLSRIDAALPPLGGVFHSVGELADAALENQGWGRFERLLWPKVLGAWELHRATLGRDLDLFVLFSSMAGVRGNPGQSNYAAANAFLDQLAGRRRALGLPGQVVQWGTWLALGEAAEAAQDRGRIADSLAASGSGWFSPQQGIEALERVVRQDLTSTAVASIDWRVFAEALPDRPPFMEDLLAPDDDAGAAAPDTQSDWVSALRGSAPADREESLVVFLQDLLQTVLRLPSAPSPTTRFFDLGMDSLMAVELRTRMNQALAGEYVVPNTAVFEHPDAASLARHLAGELGAAAAPAAAAAPPKPEPKPDVQTARPMRRQDDAVAIIGMACRLPGAADPAEFWKLLEAGEDAVANGRNGTAAWTGCVGDPAAQDAFSRRGGFVEGLDRFDAGFFGLAPIEARNMDPQQRLMLETSWQALEDAGVAPGSLAGSRTGVYFGIALSEYRDLMTAAGNAGSAFGNCGSIAVGRVAFLLGLQGPAMPVDLACASALVAVHQGVAAIRQGQAELALAGGVNAVLSPVATRSFAAMGMLSPDGRCRAFDADADGYVRGEGCGVVVLKRLTRAEADGDRIWGVIRGSAVNQNGFGADLLAPSGSAQQRVMEDALARAGVSPADVDYLEAHGVGSKLGDPIEVEAAAAAYGKGRDAERPLLIGSVKTNIGHLESASGIAGLIKVVLAMRRQVIPRQLNLRNANPLVDWARLPVRVVTEMTPWPSHPDRPPMAAVSAFGLSGTNAHAIVEGYETTDAAGPQWLASGPARKVTVPDLLPVAGLELPDGPIAGRRSRVLPLSGKSDDALVELARCYLSRLGPAAGQPGSGEGLAGAAFADMAWTAGVGRSHFNHRAAVVFHDVESLRNGLQRVKAARAPRGVAKSHKIAFRYTVGGRQWLNAGRALHETEPVARAVLDRCANVLRDASGGSLLDAMSETADVGADGNGVAAETPALYALQCALTALWGSVGIGPAVVVGNDAGILAAAHAAGAFGLDEGMRLAIALSAVERGANGVRLASAATDLAAARPSLPLISGATGRMFDKLDEALDGVSRSRPPVEPPAGQSCSEALAELAVDVVVEIGPGAAAEPGDESRTVLLASPGSPNRSGHGPAGFVDAVATAYEAGLDVAFSGLFAGEERRRVGLPTYPFQRRRHWVEFRESSSGAAD